MSAQSPHQTGVTTPQKKYFDVLPAENLWPATLKQSGYFCSSGGKVAQGYTPLPKEVHRAMFSDHRKQFSLGRRKRKLANGSASDDIEWVEMGGFRGGFASIDKVDDRTHYDHQVADSACAFFENYDSPEPFYREIGMLAAHGPWKTPVRFKEMYDERSIKKPDAWHRGFDQNDFVDSYTPENIDNSKAVFWKKSVRNYFSAMSHFDFHLGRIWDALKASRHAENTLVVILSDHGMHLGERNRFRKHTLWEQVANVPLIVHDPTRPVAQIVKDPVALIDVGPTIMDYLGMPAIKESPGQSLRPHMNLQPVPERTVPTFLENNVAIRNGRYRLIRYADGSTQFYDLEEDWWQTTNLGKDHPDFDATYDALLTCAAAYGLDVGGAPELKPGAPPEWSREGSFRFNRS